MASRFSLMQKLSPEATGNVIARDWRVVDTNAVFSAEVWEFRQLAAKMLLGGSCEIPGFGAASQVEMVWIWTSGESAGNARWGFEYALSIGDDSNTMTPTVATETVAVTTPAPSTALNRMLNQTLLTIGNLNEGETLHYNIFRDKSGAEDTIAGSIFLWDAYLLF